MKFSLFLAGLAIAVLTATSSARAEARWNEDYTAALKQAGQENKLVLLDFTGSKWCPACMVMNKSVFAKPAFAEFAEKNLVIVKIDFLSPYGPPASKDFQQEHEYLAQRFQVEVFPTYFLLTPKGQVLATQQGAFTESPAGFARWVEAARKSADSRF